GHASVGIHPSLKDTAVPRWQPLARGTPPTRGGGSAHETPRFHPAARRHRGGVGTRGACAAAGDGGGWVPRPPVWCVAFGRLRAYRQGLKEAGHIEGENVAIVYRFAENQSDRLPELATELVRRQVSMIATAGDDVALAAKAATKTIPIVFIASQDPVRLG